MGFRKIPDRYTPFYDSLADKESREAHRVDEQEYSKPINNSFAGKHNFRATVMAPMEIAQNGSPEQSTNIKHNSCYLRVEGVTDGGLCMPTDIESASTDPVEQIKLYNYVLTCHPKGNSMGITDDQSNGHLRPSDVVSCQAAEGPAYMGRLRGLTFNGTRIDRAVGFNKPGSAGQQSIQALIAEAGTTTAAGGGGSGGGAGGQLGSYIGGAGTPATTGTPGQLMTSTDSQFAKPGSHAKSFSKRSKRANPGYIKYIILHSTDGSRGPADGTLERFGRGPTLRYEYKVPSTGKIIDYPRWSEVKIHTGGVMPHKTVLRERYLKWKDAPKKDVWVEKLVNTSIHYAVDGLADGNIWQGLAEIDVAHHAPGYNTTGIGIEMCGKPNKNRGKGFSPKYSEMYNEIMLNNTAKLCADICKRNNLPPTRETIRGHEDGQSSSRTDPGETKGNFDYTDFLARVANYYKQMAGGSFSTAATQPATTAPATTAPATTTPTTTTPATTAPATTAPATTPATTAPAPTEAGDWASMWG